MSLLVRGIFWFGLYLALALAPLGAALLVDPIALRRDFGLEFGVALGLVAYALMVLEFALVGRLRGVSEPFGMDALMLFHRLMGSAALLFTLGHTALLAWRGPGLALLDPFRGGALVQSGWLALLLTLLLVGVSLGRKRLRLSYERWLLAHRVGAILLVGAMLAHALAANAYARSPIVRGVLIAYAGLFLALLLVYRLARPLRAWRKPYEVLENRDEGADTRTLVVRPLGHAGFDFAPGQFAWLVTGRSPLALEQHPISIASSAEQGAERALEFSIKDLGDWSGERVPRIRPGERLWLDGPYGSFTPDREPALGFVLIAGGIGITPMRSMLLTMRDRGDRRPALLLYAAHDPTRAIYARDFELLQRQLALRIVYVYEEPPPGWEGERGLVTRELLARHLPPMHRHHQFFVCGPGPMMDAVERSLAALGVPPERVQSERFDMV